MTWVLGVASLTIMLLNVAVLFKVLVTLDRLDEAAVLNAEIQEEMQVAARLVAKDLAARYVRADAVEGQPGEAADVAARSQQDT